jgi:hypothetical protein
MKTVTIALAATLAGIATAQAKQAAEPAPVVWWWQVPQQPAAAAPARHHWRHRYARKAERRHFVRHEPDRHPAKTVERPAPAQKAAQDAPSPPRPIDPAIAQAQATGALVGVLEGWADGMTTVAGQIGNAVVHIAAEVGCRAAAAAGARTVVDCKTGAVAYVAEDFKPFAQCVLAKFDAAGYSVRDIGGFGERSNPSAHPTGHAMDVNQCGRDCTSPRMSRSLAHEIAAECRVTSGGDWRNGDLGHFEALNSYGYTGGWKHYASARHRHGVSHVRYARHRGVGHRRYAKA